jgi:hypothetical protein
MISIETCPMLKKINLALADEGFPRKLVRALSTPSVMIGSPGVIPVIADSFRATFAASRATNPIWHNTAF